MATAGHGLLSGEWGTGKTFVALDLAAALMTGQPFVGHTVKRQCGVLFICAEGADGVRLRLDAVVREVQQIFGSRSVGMRRRLPCCTRTPSNVITMAQQAVLHCSGIRTAARSGRLDTVTAVPAIPCGGTRTMPALDRLS